MRDDSALLEEFEKSPPSFTVRLYPAHWTLNNGPKFLYNNQVSVSTYLDPLLSPADSLLVVDTRGHPSFQDTDRFHSFV